MSFGIDDDDGRDNNDSTNNNGYGNKGQFGKGLALNIDVEDEDQTAASTATPALEVTSQFGQPRQQDQKRAVKKPKRPALMLQLTDEEDRGKPESQSRVPMSIDTEENNEEFKAAPTR